MNPESHLTRLFLESHPEEAAAILERFSGEEAASLLGQIPLQDAVSVLEQMSPQTGANVLRATTPEAGASLIERMPVLQAAGLLRKIEGPKQDALLVPLPEHLRGTFSRLLIYPEHTAGALMDPQVLALHHGLQVSEAMVRMKRSAVHLIDYLYLIDSEQRLVGVIGLDELYRALPKSRLSAIAHEYVVFLPVDADVHTVINHPGWRRYHKLPVVDHQGIFLGAIRYKTLRRLEGERGKDRWGKNLLEITLKLGEAYWVGMAEVVQSLGKLSAESSTTSEKTEENNRHV